jgi:hypothetical protein
VPLNAALLGFRFELLKVVDSFFRLHSGIVHQAMEQYRLSGEIFSRVHKTEIPIPVDESLISQTNLANAQHLTR